MYLVRCYVAPATQHQKVHSSPCQSLLIHVWKAKRVQLSLQKSDEGDIVKQHKTSFCIKKTNNKNNEKNNKNKCTPKKPPACTQILFTGKDIKSVRQFLKC